MGEERWCDICEIREVEVACEVEGCTSGLGACKECEWTLFDDGVCVECWHPFWGKATA